MGLAAAVRNLTFSLTLLPVAAAVSFLLLSPVIAVSQAPKFTAHSTLSPAVSVVAHGDLNGDGYEDLIYSFSTGFGEAMGHGDGTFTEMNGTAVPISPSPFLLGDFNGDGKLDLVVRDQRPTNGFIIYFGHGDGSFRSSSSFSVPGNFQTMAAADVNHDGKTDLLLLNGGVIEVFLANGDGTFRTGPVSGASNPACCSNVHLLTGDFNGDGNIDAVVTSDIVGPGTTFEVLSGDGAGNFAEAFTYGGGYYLTMVVADVNGDGISDLIATTRDASDPGNQITEPYLAVFYGALNGAMQYAQISTQRCAVEGSNPIAVADFNGDQIPDIAFSDTECGGQNATGITVLSGKGKNEFGSETHVFSATSIGGDLFALRGNRDTKADLVFTAPTTNNTPIVALLNTTMGNFPTCPPINGFFGIFQCSPVAGSTVTSPVNFAVGAAGDEPIRKVEVWADGHKKAEQFAGAFSNYGFLNASVPLAAGSHRINVIASAWDNSQQSKVSTINVTASSSCSAPSAAGVHICSPASGSTVGSPVQVTATATVTGTLASTQLWVDGVKKYSTASASLTTSLSLPAGSHRFAVLAINTAGQKWQNAVNATVTSTSSCSAPSSAGVHICSPASGSTISSPVKVQASAKITGTIASTQLWVDGAKKYSTASNSLTTSISLSAGSHRFAVLAINTSGQKWESTVNATVK